MKRFASVLLVACVLLCTNTLCQQISISANSGVSSVSRSLTPANDPRAIALMQRVLRVIGGNGAWRVVGAATTNVTVTLPNGTQRRVHWADDWSATSVRSRRDDGPYTMIKSGNYLSLVLPNGTRKVIPKDPDVLLLAVGYPGVAILRSLQRPNCTFSTKNIYPGLWPRPPLTENQDEAVIYEQCIEPLFPSGRCNIAWIVSADTAQLRGAWLPIRALLNDSISYEQVRYDTFQPIGNLLSPSKITITRPNGHIDTLIMEPPTFSSQLQPSVFNPAK
jgi:hypothetical protein